MPTLKQSVPKYRLHRPSGRAVVTLNDRDHYLGAHGTAASKREYDRLIAEWLARDRRDLTSARSYTIVEVLAAFMAHAKIHYRDKTGQPTGTLANFRFALVELRTHYGRTEANDFGPRSLKAIQAMMIDKGLSRRTINDRCAAIKQVFKWAVSEELISPMVYHGLATVAGLSKGRTAAKEAEPIKPVAEATIEATIRHLRDTVADMVRLQRLTGMRPGEVCSMRPADVDRSQGVWLYRPTAHKTEHMGKPRVIPIGPQGQAVLSPYLLRDATAYCFSPMDSERKRRRERHAKRVVPLHHGNRPGSKQTRDPKSKAGERYTTDSYRRAVTRGADAAKVERWHPNQLRHSAATMIRSRFGLEAAQVVLGHSSADVTQVYAERDLAKAIEVAQLVG